ncbi:MAG: TRAP transporter small permease subunit [Nitrospirota bacterium]|nr:TRAP transporter small permease subunit [Nitrospirota bacterium]
MLAINGRVSSLEQYLLYLSLYAMCLGVLTQWFLRAFFKIGLNWVNEGTMFAMLWAGFLGACLATSRLEHFQIDLVRFIQRPRLKRLVRALSYLIASMFFLIFSYATLRYLLMLLKTHETSHYYDYPIWPFYTVVAYFYVSSACRFFLTALLKLF